MADRTVLSPSEFRRKALAARQQTGPGILKGSAIVLSTLTAQVEPDETDDRRLSFIVATAEENRNGWQLNPEGWKTENYMANPVMLWVHNDGGGWGGDSGSHGLPFARAEKVWIEGDVLKVTCRWVDEGDITGEAGELAESVLRLYRKGYLNAVSAGWIPLDYEFVETEDGWQIMCKEQELVEISFVPVPAEPNALRVAAAAGIDVAPLRAWARRLVGEPRYVMKVASPMSAELLAALREQFAEFYPGAKLLQVPDCIDLAALEDLTPIKTITQAELAAEAERLAAAPAETAPTAAAEGTPAPAASDAPAGDILRGTAEWRIRQLELLSL